MKENQSGPLIDTGNPEKVYRWLFEVDPDEPIQNWVKNIDIDSVSNPDFPHALHHIETVRNFSKVMAEICGLGNYWKDVLDAAVTYHDVSHGSTGSGEIPYGPHAVASSLIAYMITKNKDVADLVYSHNEDKIPNNHDEKSAAEMIIRDADQLALMGHSGLIRSAYYWGFRHKLMDDEPHKIVSEMKLCDPRCDGGGLPYDHEKNTRLFCLETVFPFLIESRQVDRAKAHSQTNIERFFGSQKLEQNFLAALRYGNSDLEKALKGEFRLSHWNLSFKAEEIQRIDERYSHLFIRKPLIDFSILQTCEAIEFFLSHFEEEEAKIEIRKLLDGGDETIPWE